LDCDICDNEQSLTTSFLYSNQYGNITSEIGAIILPLFKILSKYFFLFLYEISQNKQNLNVFSEINSDIIPKSTRPLHENTVIKLPNSYLCPEIATKFPVRSSFNNVVIPVKESKCSIFKNFLNLILKNNTNEWGINVK